VLTWGGGEPMHSTPEKENDMVTKTLQPEEIRRDGGTQPRTRLNQSTVEEYVEALQNGDTLPPIDVYHDGEIYWLADGFHRYCALTKLDPNQPIESNVHKGTLHDAQWHSYGANKTHGLRRTNEDKAQAVKRALQHANGANKSDRQIAAHVRVDPMTVGKYRKQLEATVENLQSPTRTGRDGRKINTTNIGKRTPRSSKPDRGNVPDRNAFRPKLGHSNPCPMIPLSLPLNNAELAAATLWQEFPASFIESLVQLLSQRLKQPEGEKS